MRKVALAAACTVVAALMLAMPVSAGSKTVYFTDREGDLGKPWYGIDFGSHEYGDPFSWWSGDSPIANAGYLDFVLGWVSVKSGEVTMGLEVVSPLTDDSKLPDGVTEVRWAWFFYTNTDVLNKIGPNSASYGVYILWDGADFKAALVDRTSGSPPFVVTYPDNFNVGGTVLTVTVSLDSIPDVVAWFCESQIMHSSPWPLDQWPSMGAWGAPDMTDPSPLKLYWPWQPMP